MEISMTRKRWIRLASFISAAFAVICGIAIHQHNQSEYYQMRLEQNYQRSIEEFGNHMNNITSSLNKGRFAGTSAQTTQLSAQLWRETTAAKNSLSQLPLNNVNLNNTTKFLSQCGDYAMVMSRKLSNSEDLTKEEQDNLEMLYEYAVSLNDQVQNLKEALNQAELSIEQVTAMLADENIGEGLQTISQGFQDVEGGFAGFPTLIYDGPFSDDIMERDPVMLIDAPEVSPEEARQKAAQSINLAPSKIHDDSGEQGRMPSYGFRTNTHNVSITKNGGYLSYMINGRSLGDARISTEEALRKADDYLAFLKHKDMVQTYYEVTDNMVIVNYAYFQDDVTCYTDLIKIEVALDNGEIIAYDARGYLTSHTTREFPQEIMDAEDAMAAVSKNLTVENIKLALIPSQGTSEIYTYEFQCVSSDEQKVLVYVNAVTGVEEQILILLESDHGILTI